MAEEPQPASIKEGIDPAAPNTETETDQTAPAPTTGGADSQKAAAALSALDRNSAVGTSGAGDEKERKQPSAADQKALSEAMDRLAILDGAKMGSGNAVASAGDAGAGAKKDEAPALSERARRKVEEKAAAEKEAEERRKIKVDAADVALLVEELEISKAKATDLLKGCRGDAVKALTQFVKAGI